jgi:hypothetical protein
MKLMRFRRGRPPGRASGPTCPRTAAAPRRCRGSGARATRPRVGVRRRRHTTIANLTAAARRCVKTAGDCVAVVAVYRRRASGLQPTATRLTSRFDTGLEAGVARARSGGDGRGTPPRGTRGRRGAARWGGTVRGCLSGSGTPSRLLTTGVAMMCQHY